MSSYTATSRPSRRGLRLFLRVSFPPAHRATRDVAALPLRAPLGSITVRLQLGLETLTPTVAHARANTQLFGDLGDRLGATGHHATYRVFLEGIWSGLSLLH